MLARIKKGVKNESLFSGLLLLTLLKVFCKASQFTIDSQP